MEFTREELWALQSRAEKGHANVLNENWKRAYEDLIHAISVLDAFMARSSVRESPFPTEGLVSSAIEALERKA